MEYQLSSIEEGVQRKALHIIDDEVKKKTRSALDFSKREDEWMVRFRQEKEEYEHDITELRRTLERERSHASRQESKYVYPQACGLLA